uniref:Uncharacterized protein n=1 Tax=Cyanothece sp. (strain PCC 7425 / ATCC 29141) TaxID=395961 RepID=B8HSN2_CYAP4
MVKDKRQANQTFQLLSILQIVGHLIAYVMAFVKLILIEKGGYYNIGTIVFVGMSIVSLPLMVITILLLKFGFKLSITGRRWGYVLHVLVLVWSLFMVYVCYFME